ncbi:MAG: hypothetical protein B6229_05445 [Spirochaetaceae bacterium 4572_7]|nr:MAG: hypothetical protein B6229_05445 [Spirochaetaceae bacterium 4572_7]
MILNAIPTQFQSGSSITALWVGLSNHALKSKLGLDEKPTTSPKKSAVDPAKLHLWERILK